MTRMRTLKPGFFTNDQLADVPPLGRLLFAGLWCHADKSGRLLDRPRKLKVEILPYDECDIDALLEALAAGDDPFILRYGVEGSCYIQVRKFSLHQSPHKHERESTIPAPPGWVEPDDAAPGETGNDAALTVAAPDKHHASTMQAPDMHGASPVPRRALTVTDPDRDPDRGSGEWGAGSRPPARPHEGRPAPAPPSLDELTALVADWAEEQGIAPDALALDLGRFRDGCILEADDGTRPRWARWGPEQWAAAARKWLANPDFGAGGRGATPPATRRRAPPAGDTPAKQPPRTASNAAAILRTRRA